MPDLVYPGGPYHRLVLSPHLDDAALSCGGAIHRWSAAGQAVLVVTLMTGDPPAGECSTFAETLHASWGLSAGEAFRVRREEEAAALRRLGVGYLHLGLLDCIYRRDRQGFFYPSLDAICGPIHPDDSQVEDSLRDRLAALEPLAAGAAVYAPLAIGNHVDHQLVRRAAERWRGETLLYYEDYPYVHNGGSLPPIMPPCSISVAVSEANVQARIDAIACYRSQIAVLFGTPEEMQARVRAYSRSVAEGEGWAERLRCFPAGSRNVEE